MNEFGTILKSYRLQKKCQLRQLARMLGVGEFALTKWERGDSLPASEAKVISIGIHLNLTMQEIAGLLEAGKFPKFNKRVFILECLKSDPDMSLRAIQSKAKDLGHKISPQYIRKIRRGIVI
jgi:transcriptional regulator with XRE-family HTH domain